MGPTRSYSLARGRREQPGPCSAEPDPGEETEERPPCVCTGETHTKTQGWRGTRLVSAEAVLPAPLPEGP